jgi:hypothetical protein
MREGIKDILRKVEEFRPVRAMVQAVNHFKPQKDRELTQWQEEQKRLRNRSKSNDRDFYQGR